jgi:DNA-binding NtrC family response regulator/ligand-binding sensor domain-containing protein
MLVARPKLRGVWDCFTSRDGLPDMRVESTCAGVDGSIWVGTHARGVARYDGKQFTIYSREQGLPSQGVYSIVEDPDGMLIVGTRSGLAVRERDGGFRTLPETDGVPFMWGACTTESSAWFALDRTADKEPTVCEVLGAETRMTAVDEDPDVVGEGIRCMAVDGQGRLWLGGERLYVRSGSHFERVAGGPVGPDEVKAMAPLGDGAVLISTTHGAFTTDGSSLNPFTELSYSVEGMGTVGDSVWAATRDGELLIVSADGKVELLGEAGVPVWKGGTLDRQGRIWLGTYGFGLYCFSNQRVSVANARSGLPVDAVQDVAVHRSSAYVASTKGVMSLGASMDVDALLSGSGERRIADTTALHVDPRGVLWVGKRNGSVYSVEAGEVRHFKPQTTWRHRISSIATDVEGGTWIASNFGEGVARIDADGEVCEFWADDAASVPSRVGVIVTSVDGSVYFGSEDRSLGSVVVALDGRFSRMEGVDVGEVHAACVDQEGVLWVGSDDGLHRCGSDYMLTYGMSDGLPSELITCLYCDRLGRIWIGTEGGGVGIFDGRVFQSLALDSVLCNTINGMAEAEDGTMWIATNGGLIRRELKKAEVSAGVREVAADAVYSAPSSLQLPDSVGRVIVRLEGVSQVCRSDSIVFRYRLRQRDPDWSQTSSHEVHLPQLEPGDYELEYEAVDQDLNYSPLSVLQLGIVADPRIAALNQALRMESLQGELVGNSSAMREVLKQITEVSWTDLTVLVLGETGTGKGLVARQIHDLSERKDQPFIHVNCGAVQESLIDSELFGHERGAFTGAIARRLGKFELAQGGTIFLDEIGDLPIESQARLLRVLQERTMERLGGAATLSVDVRVIAATNRDLSEAVANRSFRADLFYRLNVFPVKVPPLRDRLEDAELLATHFIESFASHLNKAVPRLSDDAREAILRYRWPGNVRELEHTIHRALVTAEHEITSKELGLEGLRPTAEQGVDDSNGREILPLAEMERRYIQQALKHTSGVIHGPKGAAQLLQLKPTTLRSRMEKLGIRKRQPRPS